MYNAAIPIAVEHQLCSSLLKSLDHFAIQKNDSFKAVLPQVTSLASFVLPMLNTPQKDTQMEFQHLLLVSFICRM